MEDCAGLDPFAATGCKFRESSKAGKTRGAPSTSQCENLEVSLLIAYLIDFNIKSDRDT